MDKELLRWDADTKEQITENLPKAKDVANTLKSQGCNYVCVIISDHWASEGIWVETQEPKLSTFDRIVYELKDKSF